MTEPRVPRANYEEIADRYDSNPVRHDLVVEPWVEGMASVLDVACGTGLWLARQRPAWPRVRWTGLDASEAMLARARQRLPGVALVHGRAEALPFGDGAHDLVACRFALHHVDAAAALDEMVRVARRRVLLENVAPELCERAWLYRFWPQALVMDRARFWTLDRVHDALEARGFVVRSEVVVRRWRMPVAEVLVEAERRDISELTLLSEEDYRAGLARLRDLARAEPRPGGVDTTIAIAKLSAEREVPAQLAG